MKNPYREGSPCWLAWERGWSDSVKNMIQKLRYTNGDRLVYEQGYRDAILDVKKMLNGEEDKNERGNKEKRAD